MRGWRVFVCVCVWVCFSATTTSRRKSRLLLFQSKFRYERSITTWIREAVFFCIGLLCFFLQHLLLLLDCGLTNATTKRIVGGYEAAVGAWPWLVSKIHLFFLSTRFNVSSCCCCCCYKVWFCSHQMHISNKLFLEFNFHVDFVFVVAKRSIYSSHWNIRSFSSICSCLN